jgi:DNA mismatch repair protein MSH3
MAIASSVLQWLTERTNCKTLFITHYPLIAENLAAKYPGQITNKHMGFIEEGERRTRIIHFLYTLAQGIAPGSYGIECARLAGLPEGLLEKATSKADTMKKSIESKTTGAR